MDYQLILTPAGRLRLHQIDGDESHGEDWSKRVSSAFSTSQASGLFTLASIGPGGSAAGGAAPGSTTPAVFLYWRDFASRYLTQLCRTPEPADPTAGVEPVPPPDESELTVLLLCAPPMEGGEYLTVEVMREIWDELDGWVRSEIDSEGAGLSEWLKRHAAAWHQVGRVCFHLAENKGDPSLPFAFLATYAPRLSKGGRVQYLPLGRALKEYAGEGNRQALIKLLTPVNRASEKVGFVKELVDTGEIFHPLAWSPAEAYRLLKEVPLLEESGLLVRLPNWWRKRPRPRVAVRIGEQKRSRFGADAMLDFRVALTLGEEELTEEELRRIMQSADGLVYVKGQWVEVDRGRLSEALAHWKRVEAEAAEGGISFIEGMRLLAGAPADLVADGAEDQEEREWSFVDAGAWLSELLSQLRNPSAFGAPTKEFRGALRPYQEVGRDWLSLLSGLGLGACLADDMGLGKTVQVISLLLAQKESDAAQRREGKPSLLVLPASLLANWKSELERFAPTLRAAFVHPSEEAPPAASGPTTAPAAPAAPAASVAPAASARTAPQSTDDSSQSPQAGAQGPPAGSDIVLTTYGMLLRRSWLLEVPWRLVILDEAQAIKNPAARQTRAVKRLKAEARIALTGTPVENRLSDLWSLFDFLSPGLLGSAERFKRFVKALEARGQERYAPLRKLVQPYILRRLKTDKSIIADLPDKIEMKAFCALSRTQAALYARSVGELADAIEGLDGMKRRGLVLAYLMRFKQICNHPSQCTGDGQYEPSDSGKFDRLREICEEIASRQEKVLVFTQFREMTEPIASYLAEVFGREGLVLHGGTAVGKRKSLVDRFQADDGPPFFVLSLKAGGTGLNLTAASHVVHFDRWWNPAVENQATDRAFRIGQHRNVVVHKFICRGTVEEKIDALIEEKSSLADDLLKNGAETLLTEMSDGELLRLVALDVDRVEV